MNLQFKVFACYLDRFDIFQSSDEVRAGKVYQKLTERGDALFIALYHDKHLRAYWRNEKVIEYKA